MGANLANEVADEKFCETTIGCKDKKMAPLLRDLMQTPNFRVVVSDDNDAIEICGALKVLLEIKSKNYLFICFAISCRTLLPVALDSSMAWSWETIPRQLSSDWDWWKWSNSLMSFIQAASCPLSSKVVALLIWLLLAMVWSSFKLSFARIFHFFCYRWPQPQVLRSLCDQWQDH